MHNSRFNGFLLILLEGLGRILCSESLAMALYEEVELIYCRNKTAVVAYNWGKSAACDV